MGERLGEAVAALAEATRWMGGALQKNPDAALAGAHALSAAVRPRRRRHLSGARRAGGGAQRRRQAQPIAIARFFAENLASAAPGLKETVIAGADSTLMLAPEALSA